MKNYALIFHYLNFIFCCIFSIVFSRIHSHNRIIQVLPLRYVIAHVHRTERAGIVDFNLKNENVVKQTPRESIDMQINQSQIQIFLQDFFVRCVFHLFFLRSFCIALIWFVDTFLHTNKNKLLHKIYQNWLFLIGSKPNSSNITPYSLAI